MAILILPFLTLFLAIFSLGLIIIRRSEETKELSAVEARRREQVNTANQAAWRRNKQMLVD